MGSAMALAAASHRRSYNVVVLSSDGECNEGVHGGGAMLAASQRVERPAWSSTSTAAGDRPQRGDHAIEPLADKWRAFGCSTHETDGHDLTRLTELLAAGPTASGSPLRSSRTGPGQGRVLMEATTTGTTASRSGRGRRGEARARSGGVRNAFADEITRLGKEDARVVLLSGDIGNKLFDKFKEHAESRFLNCGVAGANMMVSPPEWPSTAASGRLYDHPFTTTRCFEQIRVGRLLPRRPVRIVGTGSGCRMPSSAPTQPFARGHGDPAHAAWHDGARPCDEVELRQLLRAALT